MRDAALGERPSTGIHRRAVLAGIGVVLAGIYLALSLPVFGPAVEEQPELVVYLAAGVVLLVAAAKLRAPALRIGLAVVAGYLVIVGSGEAWLIWLHGAAVFGLVALVLLVGRASDPRARFVGVLSVSLAGTLVLAFFGIVLWFLFGCGGEGCLY
jgi:hypothetical protein